MNTSAARSFERRHHEEVTPDYEDIGLFKGELCELKVEVSANFTQNKRSDVVAIGFIKGGTPIDVVFAGRRRWQFGPLRSRLSGLKSKRLRELKAGRSEVTQEDISNKDVRIPVLIEGCWRMRFSMDQQGFQRRENQFMAARWIFANEANELKTFGSTPLHLIKGK